MIASKSEWDPFQTYQRIRRTDTISTSPRGIAIDDFDKDS